jgi:hypothetical protein
LEKVSEILLQVFANDDRMDHILDVKQKHCAKKKRGDEDEAVLSIIVCA